MVSFSRRWASRHFLRLLAAAAVPASLFVSASAWALPGIHGPAISLFDTRASNVVVAYRASTSDITSRFFSYNANFSSTGGNFSAQFGAHYLQLIDIPEGPAAHGAGASGVGLFSIPLTSRFDNGVPVVALLTYVGAAPTAAISGERNFFTAPLTLGLGLGVSPGSWITLAPWFEAAPSANLDTYLSRERVEYDPMVMVTPEGAITYAEPDVNALFNELVDTRFSWEVALRVGLAVELHLGDFVNARLGGYYTTLGSAFGGTPAMHLGAALGFNWDDIVPAVLPAKSRLSTETCEAVTERFLSCPQARNYQSRADGHVIQSATGSPAGPLGPGAQPRVAAPPASAQTVGRASTPQSPPAPSAQPPAPAMRAPAAPVAPPAAPVAPVRPDAVAPSPPAPQPRPLPGQSEFGPAPQGPPTRSFQ